MSGSVLAAEPCRRFPAPLSARATCCAGWYIITYGLGIYALNLLIGFLSPQLDPETEGPTLPTSKDDEFRPFIRRRHSPSRNSARRAARAPAAAVALLHLCCAPPARLLCSAQATRVQVLVLAHEGLRHRVRDDFLQRVRCAPARAPAPRRC